MAAGVGGRVRLLNASPMKKILLTLLITLSLPGAASAAGPAPAHRCLPALPSFMSLTATENVPCLKARALNAYMATHETLSGGFRWQGATWSGLVYSRAHNYTYMVYRHGAETIWIVYPGPAS